MDEKNQTKKKRIKKHHVYGVGGLTAISSIVAPQIYEGVKMTSVEQSIQDLQKEVAELKLQLSTKVDKSVIKQLLAQLKLLVQNITDVSIQKMFIAILTTIESQL